MVSTRRIVAAGLQMEKAINYKEEEEVEGEK